MIDDVVARVVEHCHGVWVADLTRQLPQAEQMDIDPLAEDVFDHDVRLKRGCLVKQVRLFVVLYSRSFKALID